jgi:hypothetical protein
MTFAFTPCVYGGENLLVRMCATNRPNPVNSREELKADRCLEPADQVGDAFESHLKMGVLSDEFLAFLRSPRDQRQLLRGFVAAVRVSRNIVAFDVAKNQAVGA